MPYEVLALKWRPRQFSDVVGQDHVTRTLINAVGSDRVAHAYLFVGPRGTGKTSIARILAKSLNCENGPAAQPCDKCCPCLEIAAGNSLDVQEIDGASNRGIEEIRSLRETVKYVPGGRYRIYIIDEVHMLTVEAFNALLKTLEEPPRHVKFLFATTEPHKVPPTIISRCQRFDLRRIPVKMITERLDVIAKAEEVDADENVLLALARASEGSLRDAESGFDQLISFKGKTIHEQDVLSVFGLVSRKSMEDLTLALLKGDVTSLIRLVEEFDRQGKDIQRLLVELLEHLLLLLVFIEGGRESVEPDLAGTTLDTMEEEAAATNSDRLIRITEILVQTTDRLRYALSRKTLLEAALIKCAGASSMVSLDAVIARINELKQAMAADARADGEPPEPVGSPALRREAVAVESSISSRMNTAEEELLLLKKNWRSVVEYVGRIATLAKNALLDAEPIAVDGDVVTIGFDREFADRVQQIEHARNRNALHEALKRELGRPVLTELKLVNSHPGEKPDEPATDQPPPAPADAEGGVKESEGGTGSIKKWMSDETVSKTLDMFEGTIIDVKE